MRKKLSAISLRLAVLTFLLFGSPFTTDNWQLSTALADVYGPTDSVVLTVGCLDTTFLDIVDPDSVWFKWWRDVAGQTIVDSAKVNSSLRTGFVRHKIKASDGSNNMGTYIAEAVVYKDGKTGIKTWSWMVKAEFDSTINLLNTVKSNIDTVKNEQRDSTFNAIEDANKENFKADTSQIKTMNENNLWGASHTWNYETRTLTSGAGSGAFGVVIRCRQSSDSSNIASAQIQVLDSVENSTIGLLTSDSQGRGFFALDNGTYCVRMYKPGWQFTVPETLKVSGDEDTTYYAFAFDPGAPPQASLCRVYGWVYDVNNQPLEGAKIEASIKTIPLRYQNIIISPYYKSTTSDDAGYWYLDLYPNSILNPSDTNYIFFIYSPSGTVLRLEATVPDEGSWELQW